MTRRPATRKTPSRQPASVQPPVMPVPEATRPAETAQQAAGEVETLVQQGMQKLQEQFQNILQGDVELDPEQRNQMGQIFEQALQDAAASTGPASEDVFDRNVWRETVDLLRQNGSVEGNEVDELIRSLDDALAPLERRESKLALEFSRRMAAEGEEAAIEWLRRQTDKESAQQAQQSTPIPRDDHPSLRNEVVKSRSRLLRGPPR